MLQINPGEVWLTRDGRKVRIYAINGRGSRPIHGAMPAGDEDVAVSWTAAGQYWSRPGAESEHDLICKYDWREELRPIWALLKPQYKFISIDLIGNGWVHQTRPQKEGSRYYNYGTLWCGQLVFPKPDCPWYETLTERP